MRASAPAGRRVDSPVFISIVGKVGEAATLVALITLVPRILGPADYGSFAIALSIVSIGSLSVAFGGAVMLSRFVQAAAADDRLLFAQTLTRRIASIRAAQVAGILTLAAAAAAIDPGRFARVTTLLVAVALVVDVAATLLYQLGLSLGHIALWSFRYSFQNSVLVGAALSLYLAVGVDGAIAGIAVSSAVALTIVVAVLDKGYLRRPVRRVPIPGNVLRFGSLQGLSGFFTQVVHRSGVAAVVVFGGSRRDAGFVAVATGIALAGTYAVWQTFAVELPRLSASAATDSAGVEVRARRLAWGAELVVAPTALVLAFGLGAVLRTVLGAHYRGIDPALGPAIAILPLAPLTALANQVAALRLRGGVRAWTTGGGAVAFAATAVSIPFVGAVGATSALLVGTVVTVLLSARLLPRAYGASLLVVALTAATAVLAVAHWA